MHPNPLSSSSNMEVNRKQKSSVSVVVPSVAQPARSSVSSKRRRIAPAPESIYSAEGVSPTTQPAVPLQADQAKGGAESDCPVFRARQAENSEDNPPHTPQDASALGLEYRNLIAPVYDFYYRDSCEVEKAPRMDSAAPGSSAASSKPAGTGAPAVKGSSAAVNHEMNESSAPGATRKRISMFFFGQSGGKRPEVPSTEPVGAGENAEAEEEQQPSAMNNLLHYGYLASPNDIAERPRLSPNPVRVAEKGLFARLKSSRGQNDDAPANEPAALQRRGTFANLRQGIRSSISKLAGKKRKRSEEDFENEGRGAEEQEQRAAKIQNRHFQFQGHSVPLHLQVPHDADGMSIPGSHEAVVDMEIEPRESPYSNEDALAALEGRDGRMSLSSAEEGPTARDSIAVCQGEENLYRVYVEAAEGGEWEMDLD